MIKTILILLFIQLYNISIAQTNLVPNWSFEEYNFYPKVTRQLDSACKKWFTPLSITNVHAPPFSYNTGSSDYFHKYAAHQMCKVPKNAFGYQNTKNGLAYSGIVLSLSVKYLPSFNFSFKEYIEIELYKYLEDNQKYCIDFYYNISNNKSKYYGTIDEIPYYPIKLGIVLTDTIVKRYLQIGSSQPLNICSTPNYETYLVSYKDTVNWIHVQGSFTAKGGERYLTIGNFECNPSDYNPDSVAVYIYIDDVRLYKCDPDSANKIDSLIIPNVFTPNGDGYNDEFEYENQQQWEFETQIFSRWGNLVYDDRESKNWDGRIDGKLAAPGVYFYVIRAVGIRGGEIRVFRGTVTVMY